MPKIESDRLESRSFFISQAFFERYETIMMMGLLEIGRYRSNETTSASEILHFDATARRNPNPEYSWHQAFLFDKPAQISKDAMRKVVTRKIDIANNNQIRGWERHYGHDGRVKLFRELTDLECKAEWRGIHELIHSEEWQQKLDHRKQVRGDQITAARKEAIDLWFRSIPNFQPTLPGLYVPMARTVYEQLLAEYKKEH